MNHGTQIHIIFPILTEERDKLKAFLLENGIGTEIHYPIPPYKQKVFDDNKWGQFPVSDYLHRCELSLPISTATNSDQVIFVASSINTFFG